MDRRVSFAAGFYFDMLSSPASVQDEYAGMAVHREPNMTIEQDEDNTVIIPAPAGPSKM